MSASPAQSILMTNISVSAVVVSYNVRELLLDCVQSLVECQRAGALHEIVIIDSASSDGSSDAVREAFPDVTVIDAPNRGYGAGANLGVAASSGEYVLVLNPDTIVPAHTCSTLAYELHANPSIAVAAPGIRYPNGDLQPSRRRFPTRLTPIFESTIFAQWWPDNPWSRRYYLHDRPENATQEVDWVVGACLMVRRAAIDHVGGFDESFWMYCEEIEWCWRFQRHGWKARYLPGVEIVHHEGASSRQDVSRRQHAFDTSRIELQRRLYGPLTAFAVMLGIKLGYLIQLGIEAGKWALGHRRDLRRGRVRFYLRLLWSSMRFDGNQQL